MSRADGEYYHRFTVISARISALNELGRYEQARAELQHADYPLNKH